VTRENTRLGIIAKSTDGSVSDLSWHDWSLARDISPEGRVLLFTEAGEGSGASYEVFLRDLDGSPAVCLGSGSALALSPDCRWVLAKAFLPSPHLVLLPTDGGEPRPLEAADLVYLQWVSWMPDGTRFVFTGNEPGCGARLYVQSLAGGKPRRLADQEGVHLTSPHAISPDGKLVAVVGPDEQVHLIPTAGGAPRPARGPGAGDLPVRWSADGTSLYVRQRGEVPARIFRVDLATARRELWAELMPPDPAGVHEILRVVLTPDAGAYAYTYTRDLSDLYLVEGLK
jgi:Tol biopolymer transport system component